MENYRIARARSMKLGTVTIRSKLGSRVLEHRASLGENLERQTNRFATLAAAIFPSPFVSFASRENLLLIYPPFYSLGYSLPREFRLRKSFLPRVIFPYLLRRLNATGSSLSKIFSQASVKNYSLFREILTPSVHKFTN